MSEEVPPVDSNSVSGGEEAPPVQQNEDAAAAVIDVPAAAAHEGAAGRFADMNLLDDDTDEEEDDDDDENPMSALPPYVLQRVDKLKELNAKRDEIMEQYLIDRAALEAKYHGLCEPLYLERAEIIKGVQDDEIAKESTTVADNETSKQSESKDESKQSESKDNGQETKVETIDDDNDKDSPEVKVVGIPQFWVCAISHMEPLAETITEEDVDCLEHLQNIRCLDEPDGTGFTLEFHFAPNDYFHNRVLKKKYEVPNLLLDDEPILKNVEGSSIQWKTGRSLTFREITKKQRGTGKNAGIVRTVKKKERSESFFHFFEPPKMPSMDDMDEEEADRLDEAFEDDYDVAQAFRSHIIPKAVMWFTGQALDDEMEQMFINEEAAAAAETDASGQNPFPPSAPGERPPECDQQN